MNALRRNKSVICVLLTTIILTGIIVYFNVYRFYGYKVSIGRNTITFVKSRIEFNKTYKKLQGEVKSKYSNITTIEDFTLDKVKVNDDSMFISGGELKKVMLKKFNIVVDAFLMKSDTRKVAYVESENQGKEILNSVKNYYYKKAGLNSVSKISVENKISYEPVKVKIGSLYENSEIVNEVVEYNNKLKMPLIAVKVVGKTTKNQVIYPTTIMRSSSKLVSGVNKVESSGIDGIRKITNEVISINNNIVSQRVIKAEITKLVQNKEVLVGSNKPTILQYASINSPSRGSISSGFGTRWGKMHKGIDIAASFGATINAALDGTVTYSAWEDGYGNVIKIDHYGGIETTYAHCSVINVKRGEVVKKGMKIGEVGSTGHSTGPHLHFEVRENGEPINPEKYIK